MDAIVPWAEMMALIEPFYPKPNPKGGRRPFELETMLRIYFLQNRYALSDPEPEEMLYDFPLFRSFAKLDSFKVKFPDESTILRFRHLLEKHDLNVAILQTVNHMLEEKNLLFRTGTIVDATLIAAPHSTKNAGNISTKRSKRQQFRKKGAIGELLERLEKITSTIRAKVEHPFRSIIKRQFHYQRIRFRGIKKNANQIDVLFALGNLYMKRSQLLVF